MGGLAVYDTSHGFGHLNRSVAVINQIAPDVPVTIRSHPNLFEHWRERLRRPATLEPHVSDAGAVNPPGDSASTDGAATLELAGKVHAEAMQRVEDEVEKLRVEKTAAVLCDAPPVPLVAARRAGVPAFLLANFTWADIYAPHARVHGNGSTKLVSEIRWAYRHATAIFRAEPALSLKRFPTVIEVGMVVTPGRNRKAELRELLGLSTTDRIIYFYIGRYGQADLRWDRVSRLESKGIHFVGFHPAPASCECPPPNLHVVSPNEWTGADLAASADAIVAKAGYGTVCEAMVAGTPIIYPPRRGFAEHRAALDPERHALQGGACRLRPARSPNFASNVSSTSLSH